jgi:hypothetical protein
MPGEDARLLGHQQGGEGQATQQHHVLAAVGEEHLEGEAVHGGQGTKGTKRTYWT